MRQKKIKAIQTVYNGYKFRSRLEARWAVFFDNIGIEYEYELEGFDLGNGDWYLPDFYLKKWDLWIEVKPTKPTLEEIRKLALMNSTVTTSDTNRIKKETIYFICGLPGIPSITLSKDGTWQLTKGYVMFSPKILVTDDDSTNPNALKGINPSETNDMFSTNSTILSNIVAPLSVFAMISGGVTLDIWPWYYKKVRGLAKIDYINRTLLSNFKDYDKDRAARFRKSKLFLSLNYGGNSIHHIYLGKGVHYTSPNLVNAYKDARKYRF